MGLIDYKDKVCVVTGAASGIGLATVKLLLEEGAEVYAMDLADVSIGNTLALTCDLSDKDSIDTVFQPFIDTFNKKTTNKMEYFVSGTYDELVFDVSEDEVEGYTTTISFYW